MSAWANAAAAGAPALAGVHESPAYVVTMMALRPADFCRQLLAALDASEGRRQRRKRDRTPDAIGMAIKRQLMERAVRENPKPEALEGWLLQCCPAAATASGSVCVT